MATIQEILGRVISSITGAVSNLKTTAKDLLVNAINEVYTMFPYGQKNQIFSATEDNTNIGKYVDVIEVGNFITSDPELDQAKGVFVGFDVIYDTFTRFSHGANAIEDNPTATIPYKPSETNSWNYNTGTDTVNSTVNSDTFIGFASRLKYSKYLHSLTLNAQNGSESFNDNDWPAVLLCYSEDPTQQVPNNAFGLNPASYKLDVTSPTIAKQFTLSLVRGRTAQHPYNINQNLHYAIVYNLGQPDQKVIANGENSGVWNTESPFGSGKNCDIKAVREGDIIKTYTTDWNDAPSGKGALRFELTVDLTSDPLLSIFRGSASYGYAALSQENAYFTNVYFSPNVNTIFDLRDGSVWEADNTGNYTINPSRNYFTEIGERRVVFNPLTRNLIYVKPDKAFEILGGGAGGGRFGYLGEDISSDADRDFNLNNHHLHITGASYFSTETLTDGNGVRGAFSISPTNVTGMVITADNSIRSYGSDDTHSFLEATDVANNKSLFLSITPTTATITDQDNVVHDLLANSGGSGGGRFGIEDNTSDVDRSVDMGGHDISIVNASGITLANSDFSANYSSVYVASQEAGIETISGDGSEKSSSFGVGSEHIVLRVDNGLSGDENTRIFTVAPSDVFISNAFGTKKLHFLLPLTDVVSPISVNGNFADSTGNITVSGIGGGGSGDMAIANYVVSETPSGVVNNLNTVFTLANTPVVGKQMVFIGVLLDEGDDYTISGSQITFVSPPPYGAKVRVTYIKQ